MIDLYVLMVMTRKMNGICMRLSHNFGVLMIVMGMRSVKIILNFFQLFLPNIICAEVLLCPNEAGWTDLLVVKRQSY